LSQPESWENICCRCGSDIKETVHPGRRACHITCGSCFYPDNPKCASCEIVGHCQLALEYLKQLRPKDNSKGCYFNEQVTGEETIYHLLEFVNAHQHLAEELGERHYLEELRRANHNSPCLRKQSLSAKPPRQNIKT
jgi:hypothetical protein